MESYKKYIEILAKNKRPRAHLYEIRSSWGNRIFKFRFCWMCLYEKIYICLFVRFDWRGNLMEKCKTIHHCCIDYRGWVCGMLWGILHGLKLHNFVSGLGIVDSIAKPLKIYCDNSTVVFFSKNNKCSKGAC